MLRRMLIMLGTTVLAAGLVGGLAAALGTAETPVAPEASRAIQLSFVSRLDAAAAEISAYDPVSQRLFVTGAGLQVIDISDPGEPEIVTTLQVEATSVAIRDGIVAAAVPADPAQDPGKVLIMDTDGVVKEELTVGALPDMLTFTPDGTKILVANEGEADATDPEGSVSIITLGSPSTVQTAGFSAFNSRRNELLGRGVRIFPSAASVAQDLEPEYISISSDGAKARVTLQEANALAVLDIGTATMTDIQPLGLKDHSKGLPALETYEWSGLPQLGATAPSATYPSGQEIDLGGFSGLAYLGSSGGKLRFLTHTDRGPNGEPVDLLSGIAGKERPFALPDFQPEVVEFVLDPASGSIELVARTGLTRADGATPVTGLPNVQTGAQGTAYTDEVGIDLFGAQLANDPLGADLEGIAVDADGSWWMVDEYRPAIYHFTSGGVLIDRFVPQGTAAAAGQPAGTFGTEVLPAVYAQRRANRGFEGIALNGSTLYAFIQSPIDNPDLANDNNSKASRDLRIVALDTAGMTVQAEYLYELDSIAGSGTAKTDKLGDAAWIGDGRIMVAERDDRTGSDSNKLIYEIDLTGATDIHDPANLSGVPAGATIESLDSEELVQAGIKPVDKRRVANAAALGYTGVSKLEGLAVVDDLGEPTLALINDNDFGVGGDPITGDGTMAMAADPEPVTVGLLAFSGSDSLDPSDKDGGIAMANWPVYGMFMPDAIASFTSGGQDYYVTANEGDARDEVERIKDLDLDPTAFPSASDLQKDAALGRLNASSIDGDLDGDGDFDRLQVYGGRSFSVWDANGSLVYDSGDVLEAVVADLFPDLFNANDGLASEFDKRSDDKGPEAEGVSVGEVEGTTYAFVGMERAAGGVMAFDMTDPAAPEFATFARSDADISPEGITFIPAGDSPNGVPLVVLTHEVSGTVTIYGVVEPGSEPDAVPGVPQVKPVLETRSVLNDVDAADAPRGARLGDADDPSIWVHPKDRARSIVITALKDGGIDVYDLDAHVLQEIAPDDVRYNNVDVAYGFRLAADKKSVGKESCVPKKAPTADIAVATDRRNDVLVVFRVDPVTRQLVDVTDPTAPLIFTPVGEESDKTTTAYGIALWQHRDCTYAFVNRRATGDLAQLKLVPKADGTVGWRTVRTFSLPIPEGGELEDAQTEGMVVDERSGWLYIGQEGVGIWKVPAQAGSRVKPRLIHSVESSYLEPDVEGLTIYYGRGMKGYLLASSQGDNTFAVFSRTGNNRYLGSFQIVPDGDVDGSQECDGAQVMSLPMGPRFPCGLLVVQDGYNDPQFMVHDDGEFENSNANFKFVRWDQVAKAAHLMIDTRGYDPRR